MLHSKAPYALLLLVFLGTSCESKTPPLPKVKHTNNVKSLTKDRVSIPEPKVPNEPGKYHPALSKLEGEYNREVHLQTQKCETCHAAISNEWKESVHALGSLNNPYYKASFDTFSKDSGQKKTPFCAGCHDPLLMFSNTLTTGIKVDDPANYTGVNCNTCHGITEASTEGNASYTLQTSPIPYPDVENPKKEDVLAHKKRLTALKSNALCASCHIGFFSPDSGHGAVVPGINEYAPWRGSGYNGNPTTRIDQVEERSCVSCHMPLIKKGKQSYRSHRFAGGHSTLAGAIGSKDQLAAIQKMVQSAATIRVAAMGRDAIKIQTLKKVKKGDNLWFDIVVFNKGAGHSFPGGALDLRDTWIELEIFDANHKRIAHAGLQHEKTMKDPTAFRLKATMSSPDGKIVKGHQVAEFRVPISNRTIKTRDARVARYRWKVERTPKLPLEIKTRLRHRRLDHSLFKLGCDQASDPKGKAFIANTKKYLGINMNPCTTQPIIEVAKHTRHLPSTTEKEDWRVQYHRGLGLLKQLQESVEEAEDAFNYAKRLLPSEASKLDRARIEFALGKVASRQGQVQSAMDFFTKTERLIGPHSAVDYARGQVQQHTFHNEEAVKWFTKAAERTSDDRIFRQLAISSGSIMKPEAAYKAALLGLAIEPRDPHLLRSQMLALKKLDKTKSSVAIKAFKKYKRDEQSGIIRNKCVGNSAACRQARLPIPVIMLRTSK